MKKMWLIGFICSLLFLLNLYNIYAESIIDVRLFVYEDDTAIEDKIFLTDGRASEYFQTGDYNLSLYDNDQDLLWNQPLDFYFGTYNGPVELGIDYSEVYYDSDYLSFRIPYTTNMYELRLYHGENLIFSKVLNFCNNNGDCDSSETFESCPLDCPLGYNDVICISDEDGVCDPDCGLGVDSDCVLEFYPYAGEDKEAFVGEVVSFRGEVINPGIGVYTYKWFFEDDGSTETGQDVVHVFGEDGVYAVELTVMDQEDISKTDTLLVTVSVTPRHLKKLSLKKLESVKIDCDYRWWQWWKWLFNKKCKQNKIVDHVIGKIDSSLRPYLWVDDLHLSVEHGEKVFMNEYKAVKYMMAKKKVVSEEAKTVFEEVILNLVDADKLIARTIIEDAKITPVVDPKNQEKVDKELIAAEDEFDKAEQSVAQEKFDKAILHYKKAWEHAQFAIKFAKKEKSKCWLWWKCKEERKGEKEEKISVIDAWGKFLDKVGGGYRGR